MLFRSTKLTNGHVNFFIIVLAELSKILLVAKSSIQAEVHTLTKTLIGLFDSIIRFIAHVAKTFVGLFDSIIRFLSSFSFQILRGLNRIFQGGVRLAKQLILLSLKLVLFPTFIVYMVRGRIRFKKDAKRVVK